MALTIKSRRIKLETLEKDFDLVIDVTSKSSGNGVRFSPFYPHGNIPVPFSDGYFSQSVEGIWQGLKVFDQYDIDKSKFEIIGMKGIKRTIKKYGNVSGHRRGVEGKELLDYREARYQVYLPSYKWVLDNKLQREVEELKNLSGKKNIVLLDYETNCNINDLRKPLSHAYLIKLYIERNYP